MKLNSEAIKKVEQNSHEIIKWISETVKNPDYLEMPEMTSSDEEKNKLQIIIEVVKKAAMIVNESEHKLPVDLTLDDLVKTLENKLSKEET